MCQALHQHPFIYIVAFNLPDTLCDGDFASPLSQMLKPKALEVGRVDI